MHYSVFPSPLGHLLLVSDGEALVGLSMEPHGRDPEREAGWRRDDRALGFASAQLAAYFAGDLRRFDLPLRFPGTEFQRRVWQALPEIPFGEAVSYAELARRIGAPGAARAVGGALGQNPIAVVVPCHRVVASGGRIGGFGGGLDRKRWLLEHEGVVLGDPGRPGPEARPAPSHPGRVSPKLLP